MRIRNAKEEDYHARISMVFHTDSEILPECDVATVKPTQFHASYIVKQTR